MPNLGWMLLIGLLAIVVYVVLFQHAGMVVA